MSIASLSHIIKYFKGNELSAEEKAALVEEVLLMTLARATSADCNIDSVEVETVQKIIKAETGNDVSAQDVRIAAISDLFKEATLEKYLTKVRSKLDAEDRKLIARALAHLIKVDGKVSPFEVDFFNMVAEALSLSAADVAGLAEDTIKI